jgi:hypothetical protein
VDAALGDLSDKRRASEAWVMAAAVELDQGQAPARPRTRGDCFGGPRPCPWASCRWHLWPTVAATTLHAGRTPPEPDELAETCALDVADRGGATLDEVGEACHVTRERIRQIEARALPRLHRVCQRLGLRIEDLVFERHVGWLAGLITGSRCRPELEASPAGRATRMRQPEADDDQVDDADADEPINEDVPSMASSEKPSVDSDADADIDVREEERTMSAMSKALEEIKRLFELDDEIAALEEERERLRAELGQDPELVAVAKRLGWRPPKSPAHKEAPGAAAARPPTPTQPYTPPPGSQPARVLEALRGGPLSIAELAERVDVPLASVPAVCSKLRQRGLIAVDADGRRRLVEAP